MKPADGCHGFVLDPVRPTDNRSLPASIANVLVVVSFALISMVSPVMGVTYPFGATASCQTTTF